MDVVYPRCCGLDLHKAKIVACVLVPGVAGRPAKEIRTFGTMTADLLELADWLRAADCTHVAMESTGVYWKPVYNLLEEEFTLLLANARHLKAVPGRKTDVRDCEWIATLLRHGLLQPSFVPPRPQREVRELTRYRTALVEERSAEVNRLQKTLEGANIKLAAVASNVVGVSARQMLEGLVAGETDAAVLAELAQGRLREKRPQLERALSGSVGPHQQFLVAQQLAHIDFLEATIEVVSEEITARLRAVELPATGEAPVAPTAPGDAALARLQTLPGVGQRTAEVLVAEIGLDMRRFRTARHLASWAGLCPGNHESAGKRRRGRTRKGSRWLRSALVQAAHAAARQKETYFAAQYRRLAQRRGSKRAAVAVAHSLLGCVYALLRDGTTYRELGADYFVQRDPAAYARRLVRGLEQLGHKVTLEPADPAA
jgi:transposase